MAAEKKIRAGLVGVTGYTGMELVRLLEGHPAMQLVRVTSRKDAGARLDSLYPFTQGFASGELIVTEPDPDDLAVACDVVFLAIPHGAAMDMGAALLAKGCKVVDLSADYRIRDVAIYESWYKVTHSQTAVLQQAVYGLPEIYAHDIAEAKLVANPGCYPTASILALYPALREKLVLSEGIVIDAKSGTTGAGRNAQVGSLFCEVYDSFKAYNLGKHRHTPEIEQELSLAASTPVVLSFSTHLLPVNRGILVTAYANLANPLLTDEDIHAAYDTFYAKHRFIRVLPLGKLPDLRQVRGTMFCDIGLVVDHRTHRLLVVSVIDNLCRGASGQAVANANLMMRLPVDTGLWLPPLVP